MRGSRGGRGGRRPRSSWRCGREPCCGARTAGADKEIAAELGVSHGKVYRWRSRFNRLRLVGLSDDPRPGRPASILLDQVEDVPMATLQSAPGQDTRWSAGLDGQALRAR